MRALRSRTSCGAIAALVAYATVAGAPPAAFAAARPTELAQAVAVAAESRSPVVTLHDMAVSVGHARGLPGNVVHSSAEHLEVTFAAQAKVLRGLGQALASPTAALGKSLSTYGALAAQVAGASAKKGATMPAVFSKALVANDKTWLGALGALGHADHVNLLEEVPTLLYPKSKI